MHKSVYDRMIKHYRKIALVRFAGYFSLFLLFIVAFTFMLDDRRDLFIYVNTWIFIVIMAIFLFLSLDSLKIYICSLLEKRYDKVCRVQVFINTINWSASIDEENFMSWFYPSKQNAKRLKVICITESGHKIKCLTICSEKKRDMLFDLIRQNKLLILTFGKYSKIIYRYDSVDEKADHDLVEKLNKTF